MRGLYIPSPHEDIVLSPVLVLLRVDPVKLMGMTIRLINFSGSNLIYLEYNPKFQVLHNHEIKPFKFNVMCSTHMVFLGETAGQKEKK